MNVTLFTAVVGLLASSGDALAQDAPITVLVTGLRFGGGSVRADLCTPDTFLKSTCPYSAAAKAVEGTTTVVFENVPPGVYAIQAFHDWNDNRKVDRGPLGIPREGLGFSNDAPLGLHGPSFSRSAITHTTEAQTITIKLHHFSRPPS